MDSVYRWIAKHQQVVYFSTCGVFGGLLAMMKNRFGLPFFPTILSVVAIVYIIAVLIVSCAGSSLTMATVWQSSTGSKNYWKPYKH